MSTVPPNEAKQNCIDPSVERGPDATHDARAKQARPTTATDQAVKAAADDEALVGPAASLCEQLKSEVIEIPLHDLFVEYANGRWIRGSYRIVTDRGTKATVRVSVDTLQQYATERSIRINPKVQAAFDKMMRAKRIRRPFRRPPFTAEDIEKAQQELSRTQFRAILREAIVGAVRKKPAPSLCETSRPKRERVRSTCAGMTGATRLKDEQP
ncbi:MULTISPECIES: hypothetical protein [unclassified Bradyrhizobium]